MELRYLIDTLNRATKAYDEGKPLITDKEWDSLYFELQELEKSYGIIYNDSPTQTINYDVVNELNKVQHNHKMLSLEKTKSPEEVLDFVGKKIFLIMCKMDGLTCSLTYKNGELVAAETRGNGIIGEDILHNARVIPSIPKKIPYMDEITIDGEIICTYKNFEDFSSSYKNPRNFASGSIRLLDSAECAARRLTFVVWDVITPMYTEDNIECCLESKLMTLQDFGFTIVPYLYVSPIGYDIKDLEKDIELIKYQAQQHSYPIDGAVVKFNDCVYGRSLGETSHHFKNALAFKFYDETYETRLTNIEWTMGRTGVLTPVAIFEPVDIDGSEVSRASLHNISIMRELLGDHPHLNQKIEVYKANMIIPQIYKADLTPPGTLYYFENEDFEVPSVCPICGEPAEEICELDSCVLKCMNPSCEGKLINRIDHFCGKKGLDIKGLSKATFEKLIDWGWITSLSDIFELHQYKNEWIQKPGFGVKSVEKMLDAIDAGRRCDLHQFISAIGIPLIGTTASKALCQVFHSWKEFIDAVDNVYAFHSLPNFGFEMHNSITLFNYREALYIAEKYILFNEYVETKSGSDLANKTFVITGKLTQFKNRDELKAKIESLGGKVTGSVSKNTDYLINNDVESTSSKNKTAKSLGIPILSESDFIQTFGIS